MKNKLIIAGGNGYIGNILVNYFKDNYHIFIITRSKSVIKNHINYINWEDNWQSELENTDVVINLAGKSINCLFTTKNKIEILQSRLAATSKINKAISACKNPPKLIINASGASIYKPSLSNKYTESNTNYGTGFLAEVCKQWESEFTKTNTPETRKVIIRITPVLGKESHAIKPLLKVVALGLGGKQGSGKQYFSWVHELDFAGAISFIIKNKDINGIVNLASPNAISNTDFMSTFRKTMRIPIGLPTPTFLLHLSKYFTKVEPELILDSINIYPKKLTDFGFEFKMNSIEKALKEIVN